MPRRSLSENTRADLPRRCFEVSWEVGNKVGGIYTVVTSKAARMMECYPDGYFLVGPYFSPEQAKRELERVEVPDWLHVVSGRLERKGIPVHLGRWKIKGSPPVILVDFRAWWPRLNEIKAKLWEWYRIDSLDAAHDFDEPLVWSWAVGQLLEEAAREAGETVFHFHEWLTGGALLYLTHARRDAPTVFTTHATVAGRALANRGIDLYRMRAAIDAEAAARDLFVHAKHGVEKASALQCDVFTTVSAVTAGEAEQFLGRRPEVLLPNGLDIGTYPPISRQLARHEEEKRALWDFAAYFFFPFYRFSLTDTLFYYTASRYEFRDKGIDILIAALGRLNETLKKKRSRQTVVTFFWVPGAAAGPVPEVIARRRAYREFVKETRLRGRPPGPEEVGKYLESPRPALISKLNFKAIAALRALSDQRGGAPSTTHLLADPNDKILAEFRAHRLLNRAEDRVKVVFYPVYLVKGDEFLNLGYHKSLQAGHFGLYPSYYEPWGYTPLETAALGVPALATDLSGFGQYLLSEGRERSEKYPGIFILRRARRSDREAVEELAGFLTEFASWSRRDRHRNAARARELAELADWKFFIRHYLEAHRLALAKHDRKL